MDYYCLEQVFPPLITAGQNIINIKALRSLPQQSELVGPRSGRKEREPIRSEHDVCHYLSTWSYCSFWKQWVKNCGECLAVSWDWRVWIKSESEVKVTFDSLWPCNSPGQNTWVGRLSVLQRIFPTQGLNSGLPHSSQILYQLSQQGSPRILEWVAYPFSSRSSWPRNQTGVSWIAGFFTNWATREAPKRKRGPSKYSRLLVRTLMGYSN